MTEFAGDNQLFRQKKKKKVDLIRASGGSKNSYFADNKIVGDIQQ